MNPEHSAPVSLTSHEGQPVPLPPPTQRSENVLTDPETLLGMVESLRRPYPLERSVVLIPVAALQDNDRIYPALEQYAQSEGQAPFSLALNLNQPSDVPEDWIGQAQAEVDRASHDFPQLDVRTIHRHYDTPTIGAIRKDLWDATVVLARQESSTDELEQYLGYNHDIDLVRLPPSYMRQTQTAARTRSRPLATTPVRHYRSGDFPEADRVTAIYDFVTSGVGEAYYEAGLIIPFDTYDKSGGFQPDDIIHETRAIARSRAVTNAAASAMTVKSVPLYTSPRRLIQSAANGVSADRIWTDDTFSANDTCRDMTHDVAARITPAQAQEFGREFVCRTLPMYLGTGAATLFYSDPATPAYARSFKLTEEDRQRHHDYYEEKMVLAARGLRAILGMSTEEAARLVLAAKRRSKLQ